MCDITTKIYKIMMIKY